MFSLCILIQQLRDVSKQSKNKGSRKNTPRKKCPQGNYPPEICPPGKIRPGKLPQYSQHTLSILSGIEYDN